MFAFQPPLVKVTKEIPRSTPAISGNGEFLRSHFNHCLVYNLQGTNFASAVSFVTSELKNKISQISVQPSRDLLFVNIKKNEDLAPLLTYQITIKGVVIPVTPSFPEDANLVRIQLEKLLFEDAKEMQEKIERFFEQFNTTALYVHFDKIYGFYCDTATVYLDIKNNPTVLKTLPRYVDSPVIKCSLNWEGAETRSISKIINGTKLAQEIQDSARDVTEESQESAQDVIKETPKIVQDVTEEIQESAQDVAEPKEELNNECVSTPALPNPGIETSERSINTMDQKMSSQSNLPMPQGSNVKDAIETGDKSLTLTQNPRAIIDTQFTFTSSVCGSDVLGGSGKKVRSLRRR